MALLWPFALAAQTPIAGDTMRKPAAIEAQRYRPMAGPRLGASLPDPQPLPHGSLALGLSASYANRLNAGSELSPRGQFTDLSTVDVGAALGLFGMLELGVVLPFSTARLLPQPTEVDARFGMGALRTSFKVALLSDELFRLAATLEATLPTALPGYPFGDGAWSWTPGLASRLRLGLFTLALTASYRVRDYILVTDRLVVDDALLFGAAAELQLVQPLALFVELTGDIATRHRKRELASGVRLNGVSESVRPYARDGAELSAGVKVQVAKEMWVLGGAGIGLPGMTAAYAVPELRAFVSAAFTLDAFPCAAGGEDYDGFRDSDGCADPDNDEDGIADVHDQCDNDSEDVDGFADDDGCPDRDNDADGFIDSRDACPDSTEDWDGFEDSDGCPEPDNDEDGIADGYDVCAVEPEDLDGFEDTDGCPEPGPQPATVTVEGDRILVSEPIYFEDDRDVIREVSAPVLAQLALLVRGLSADKRVLILAHTDGVGREDHGLDLSRRRAEAVRAALVAQGVVPERLTSEGRGGAEPLASNDTPEGRAMNRRIELRLVGVAQNAAP